ncbi:MAG: hypothetical protein LBT45_01550 [Rickettsiales bacterium]|nr:hypothetical protein [Rickettsiales bacterium]
MAHLLLGEDKRWGDDVPALLKKLFPATGKHTMISDFPQDPEIDFALIENLAADNGFKVSRMTIVPCVPPFIMNSGADSVRFQGDFYKSVLLEKI